MATYPFEIGIITCLITFIALNVDVPTDNYHQQLENYASEMLPVPPPPKTQVYQPPPAYQNQNPPYQNQGYQNQNTSYQNQNTSYQNSYQPPVQYDHRPKYEEYTQPKYDEYQQNQFAYGQYQQPAANYGVGSQQKIGRIQDYDPLSDGPRSAPNTQRASATLIYNSTSDGKRENTPSTLHKSTQANRCNDDDDDGDDDDDVNGDDDDDGNDDDDDDGNDDYNDDDDDLPVSLCVCRSAPAGGADAAVGAWPTWTLAGEKAAYASPEQNYMQVVIPKHSADVKQKVYVAMYDYEANDSDEVSFREGDFICNVTAIDEGWMTGQVLRTGRTGMLPANYVDLAPAGTYTH
ncbi:hypothetical protein MSG28_015147 [Choristoneura fumiferana]|uniref:Uncharacterized protein n=1 Tax=Choristoneura fumiferana TaxID=7141 RepID=A0ACC0KZ09_CHOFU|nr:hypothetical protein MSG28_015147 [Choristoneura fumiferana]